MQCKELCNWPYSFFSFTPLLQCFKNGLAEAFLTMFNNSLTRKSVTMIGLMSLYFMASVFVSVLFIAKFRLCKHNMPCALEINSNGSNGGFKQEHVESCFSTTKNVASPLPHCLWPPNLAEWQLTMKGSHP